MTSWVLHSILEKAIRKGPPNCFGGPCYARLAVASWCDFHGCPDVSGLRSRWHWSMIRNCGVVRLSAPPRPFFLKNTTACAGVLAGFQSCHGFLLSYGEKSPETENNRLEARRQFLGIASTSLARAWVDCYRRGDRLQSRTLMELQSMSVLLYLAL